MNHDNLTTRKQLIDALCTILDGQNKFDIYNNTGLDLQKCADILEIANSVKDEWLLST